MTKNEQIQILDRIVYKYLYIRHSGYCQIADVEDLKQEVLMRLGKIMPDSFDSDRHFFNWCRKFGKMYSINAFRDYLTTLRHRPREILVGNLDEKLIENASCDLFWQKEGLEERKEKFVDWTYGIDDQQFEMAQILLSNNTAVTAVAQELGISKNKASRRLKNAGLRTKFVNQIRRYDENI